MIRERKRPSVEKNKLRKLKNLFFLLIILFFAFGFGKKVFRWFAGSWNGKSQISLAVEAKEGKVLVLVITPSKNIAGLLILPSNLEIETPWFGRYRADKLSLLAKQEDKISIFPRSLAYFLKIPIDLGLVKTKLSFSEDEAVLKERIRRLFFPPMTVDYWRLWRAFENRDLYWKIVDLSDFSQERTLPDGSFLLTLDDGGDLGGLLEYFSDPAVKKENLSIGVTNLGQISGLAQRVSDLVANLGGRVIEMNGGDFNLKEDCLILINEDRLAETTTVSRLSSVLGCDIRQDSDLTALDLQILIRNVRI
ncbi:MAG: hypothetical protein ABH867_04890 [Patescibacteria group bacterium]|nr:hypothetical protein [Patescibacteria group bacterium]